MFAKHLPPSPGLPCVLALDDSATAELPADVQLIGPARLIFSAQAIPLAPGGLDAVVGYAAPDRLEALLPLLRPGGRLILAHRAEPQALLAALTTAGFIHCLVEPVGEFTLYRGERPPLGSAVERLQVLSTGSPAPPLPHFIFLLITQTPNKPMWKLAPGEKLEWRAATFLDPATGQPTLLAFSSLVKAVAFMQAAILARGIGGVNKVGKFRAVVAQTWALPLRLNPTFDDLRWAALGPPYSVDPGAAIMGAE